MTESVTAFEMCGSSWRFRSVSTLDNNIIAYRPLRGNSYVELPTLLAAKKQLLTRKAKPISILNGQLQES